MSKVWIVSVGDINESSIHGVFSSEDKAKEYIAALNDHWKREAFIEEYVIDEPFTNA